MAGDVMRRSASEAQAAPKGTTLPARAESRADRARRLVYRGRFAILYLLLAVVAGAAVGALVVLVGRGSPSPAPPWSEWEPTGTAERRVAQIGDHVSDPYRLPSGKELATVTYAGPPTVTGPDGSTFQVRAIAVRPDTSGGRAETTDVDTFNAASTVMYNLCGLGAACSIPEGRASVARGALLRRAALELALYSFTYVEGVESVAVLLPPRADGNASTAVFLERSDVRTALSRPLNQTLTAPLTPGVGEIPPDELRYIERTTQARLYSYNYLQAQDGSPVMVLSSALSG
ncbi:MAG: hypothetical protein ACRDNY_09175 [Gaiellaceae bacterium]